MGSPAPQSCPGCGAALPPSGECLKCGPVTAPIVRRKPTDPVIPGHEILGTIGKGGMGVVYLARDEALGRLVAVKAIKDAASGEESLARFRREARAMASVEHANVVRVYAFGESESRPFLVMEYVEGETLAARLSREGRLGVAEALRIVGEAALGLAAAHDQGLVHRDVKPSNLLLDVRGRVRVTDFGLAKSRPSEEESLLTPSGDVLGTPHYLAPEQAAGGDVDSPADIFALGVVLFEMLAGRRPFEGATPVVLIGQILQGRVPALRALRPEVPEEVEALVSWMTHREPLERPTYAALLERVDAIRAGSTTLEVATAALRAMPPPTPPRPSGTTTLPAATAPAAPVAAPDPAATASPAPRSGWGFRVVATLLLWGVALAQLGSQGRIPDPIPPGEKRSFTVAVVPFHGPDDSSLREGRLMAGLVERAMRERFTGDNVRIHGLEEPGVVPVRSDGEARALGGKLESEAVVWGTAIAIDGQVELEPHVTLVLADDGEEEGDVPAPELEELRHASGPAIRAGTSGGEDALELRKEGARRVGERVGLLLGADALHRLQDPTRALAELRRISPSATARRFEADALATLGRLPEALDVLDQAVAADPVGAAAAGRRGDVLLLLERWSDAAAAYEEAQRLDPAVATTQGTLYQGILYGREWFAESPARRLDTGYLLARDPQTGRVLDRHRCQGTPWSMGVRDGELRARCVAMRGGVSFDVVLESGVLAAPLAYEPNVQQRARLWNHGLRLAANFRSERGLDLSKPVDRCVADAPQDLDALRVVAERRRGEDPTQPWHGMLLGAVLGAHGDAPAAAQQWELMLTTLRADVPYFDLARMTELFERAGEKGFADRAFAEALRRRDALPRFPGTTTLLERLLNVTFLRAARDAEPDRAHLWLERARELSGDLGEDDDLAAAAWAHYFDERGEGERADEERRHMREVHRNPLNIRARAVVSDGLIGAVFASVLALPMMLALLLRRSWGRGASIAALLAAISILGVPLLLGRAAAPVPDGDGRWPLPARASLAVAAAALGALWLPRASAALTAQGRGTRVVLAAAAMTVGLAVAWSVVLAKEVEACRSIDLFSDALGHPEAVRQYERRLRHADSVPGRYLLAVICHVARDDARAAQLYESIRLEEKRAKTNAASLKAHRMPDVTFDASDLWKVIGPSPLEAGRQIASAHGAHVAGYALLIALLLGLAFVPRRAAAADAAVEPAARGVGRHASRLVRLVVPGWHDLRHGSVVRGYAALLLALFPAAILIVLFWGPQITRSPEIPHYGALTSFAGSEAIWRMPLPPDPGGRPEAPHFWTFFWAFPYARTFWGLVAGSALVALGLHVSRLREIWRG